MGKEKKDYRTITAGRYSNCALVLEGTYHTIINLAENLPPDSLKIMDQGEHGVCWAVSVKSATEFEYIYAGKEHKPLSHQHLMDCVYLPGEAVNGGRPTVGLEFVKSSGLCIEADYASTGVPLKSTDERPVIPPTAEKRFIDDWYPLSSEESAMLAALHDDHVLIVTLDVYKPFHMLKGKRLFDLEMARRKHLKLKTKYEVGEHSLLIVGAGYFIPKKAPYLRFNYWILFNSWGINWAFDGFGYLLRHSTLEQLHDDLQSYDYCPVFPYIRRQGRADPEFVFNVQQGLSTKTLVKWIVKEKKFGKFVLIYFFFEPGYCAQVGMYPDQLLNSLGKVFHKFHSYWKTVLVNVNENRSAATRFKKVIGPNQTQLLVYLRDRKPSICDATRYDGPFNLDNTLEWLSLVLASVHGDEASCYRMMMMQLKDL